MDGSSLRIRNQAKGRMSHEGSTKKTQGGAKKEKRIKRLKRENGEREMGDEGG